MNSVNALAMLDMAQDMAMIMCAYAVGSNDNYNFVVARFKRRLSNGNLVTHFVIIDPMNPHIVLWDPYSPDGSKTVREGWVDGYRYIFAEAI